MNSKLQPKRLSVQLRNSHHSACKRDVVSLCMEKSTNEPFTIDPVGGGEGEKIHGKSVRFISHRFFTFVTENENVKLVIDLYLPNRRIIGH